MSPSAMRAVRLTTVGDDPRVEEVAVPEPGPGQVRVAMRACGICGSDLHIIEGSTAAGILPLTLGHEPAGVVDAVGEGVTSPAVGDRVVVNSMISCGHCRACTGGRRNVCDNLVLMGVEAHGAHADYFVAPAENCVAIPDGIAFAEAAVVTDSAATPMHAIKRSGVRPGDTAAVFGVGGLGSYAVSLLTRVFGARVIAIDAYDLALGRALSLGADSVVDARTGRTAGAVAALADGGVDVAFDFVGSVDVVEQGLRALRPGGTCVAVGVTPQRLGLSVRQETLVARELGLVGSLGFLREDIVELLDLAAAGQIDLGLGISHRFELGEYETGLDVLRDRGAGPMRVMITNEEGA